MGALGRAADMFGSDLSNDSDMKHKILTLTIYLLICEWWLYARPAGGSVVLTLLDTRPWV